jgi:hypothetical protein
MLHLLKLKKNYTNLLTAFLLILYAFIATPVSLWHHHKSACDKNYPEEHALVVKEFKVSVEAKCIICIHHYSVALNDASIIYFSPVVLFNSVAHFDFLKKIAATRYAQYNKGPPGYIYFSTLHAC